MARTDNLNNFLTDVADAIRNKTGETGVITASEFDTKINSIQAGGGNISEYFSIYKITNSISYIGNRIIKEIPNSILQELLENINQKNNITSMSYMFRYFSVLESLDLSNFNTSNITNMNSTFSECEKLATINFGTNFDTSKVTTMSGMFSLCRELRNIPKLNASKVADISGAFTSCNYLTDFGGLENLGMAYSTTQSANYSSYKLDLHYSKNLTHESLMNVINNLYDIATKGCNAQSLVLGTTNLAKLSEEEIAIATSKGWNVT